MTSHPEYVRYCSGVLFHGDFKATLVDSCDDNAYDELLASMEVVWNDREHQVFSDRKSHKPEFHSWFMKYKAKEFRETHIKGP